MNRSTTLAGLAMLAMLGISEGATAMPQDVTDDQRTVSVSGEGRISAAPDVAEINLGVLTEAATASEALSSNSQAMAALTEQLKARGVAAKDIQTSNISLEPKYNQANQLQRQGQGEPFTPQIVGYSASNTVRITSRDLSKLGEVLDAVVGAGGNRINGISFRVDKPAPLLDEARKQAIADAKRKAEQLCGESGMVLGAPIRISESGGYSPPPQPMLMARTMSASASVPVSAGEQELTIGVQVVFEMTVPE